MAATFPLPLASLNDLFLVASGMWMPARQQEINGLGSAEFSTAELGPSYWRARVDLAPMEMADFLKVRSRFMLLDGSRQTFLYASPESSYPQADPQGEAVAASTVRIKSVGSDNKSVALKGLPAGYVITEGDFFGVTYSTSRRALYVANATVTADGSGDTAEFECRFHVRPGTAANDLVSLAPAVAKVKLLPNSLSWNGKGKLVNMSFDIQQTLGL